jgi:DNA modification methylase
MTVRIINADVLAGLAELPDESVHCVVTSPPYWGLRDYGQPGQIGLEATPEAFVARMVEVFRDVRRVMRNDATLWLNLGDSFRNKQLLGIPWRVALALQADGWWLRSEIIWSKPNQMPEAVTDRPTKAHEQIFLLAKRERYYFDADAIKDATAQPLGVAKLTGQHKANAGGFTTNGTGNSTLGSNQGEASRNARSVWTIATAPFAEAHFATFPPELPARCIKAGCPPGGTVLDCFGGAGTTGLVADRLQRNAILIELNPAYAAMAEKRIANDAGGLFAAVSVARPVEQQLALPEAAE